MNAQDAPSGDNPFPRLSAGWSSPLVHAYGGNNRYDFSPCAISQNSTISPFYIRFFATDTPDQSNDEFGKITGNPQPSYYADPDGVVRRATGAYVPAAASGIKAGAASPIGLPVALTQKSPRVSPAIKTDPTQDFNQAQSRPLILNRPFRSPAELGYVFRDTPWRNLDFFTPESGDKALLDVFCVTVTDGQNMLAGKVNLNTRAAPVLSAIIAGAYIDDRKVTNTTVGALSATSPSTVPTTIANALNSRTADLGVTTNGPMQNIADLIGKWMSPQAITAPVGYVPANTDLTLSNGYKDGRLSYSGFSGSSAVTTGNPKDLSAAIQAASFSNVLLKQSFAQIQRFREAPVRALTSVGQTRVWNVMIDVIAQTGRYPSSATKLDNFAVEGEQRYWVHLAIDRLTGRVIDRQIEVVKE